MLVFANYYNNINLIFLYITKFNISSIYKDYLINTNIELK
jgi:hypothetical protein